MVILCQCNLLFGQLVITKVCEYMLDILLCITYHIDLSVFFEQCFSNLQEIYSFSKSLQEKGEGSDLRFPGGTLWLLCLQILGNIHLNHITRFLFKCVEIGKEYACAFMHFLAISVRLTMGEHSDGLHPLLAEFLESLYFL